jgi:hypothetical protein
LPSAASAGNAATNASCCTFDTPENLHPLFAFCLPFRQLTFTGDVRERWATFTNRRSHHVAQFEPLGGQAVHATRLSTTRLAQFAIVPMNSLGAKMVVFTTGRDREVDMGVCCVG